MKPKCDDACQNWAEYSLEIPYHPKPVVFHACRTHLRSVMEMAFYEYEALEFRVSWVEGQEPPS